MDLGIPRSIIYVYIYIYDIYISHLLYDYIYATIGIVKARVKANVIIV